MGKYLDSTGLSKVFTLIKGKLLPAGGSAGQVLAKSSATDYDVGWVTAQGGVTVDSALSSTSENPVQNKVIDSALGGKADSSHSHTVQDITDLGSWLNSDISTAASFNHNTFTTLTSLTLTRGVWVVTWGLVFAANATGVRMGAVVNDQTTSFNNTSGRRTNGMRVSACSSGETIIHGSYVTRVNTNTTIYLRGAHTAGSGTSLNVTGCLRAVKVGYY